MKLEHINKSVPASEYSELDFLKAENTFLQDELKLQEMEHSLELYETIFDCISKEGKVSKSLELMFGENASSVETFEAELKEQYDATVEGLFSVVGKLAKYAVGDPIIGKIKEKAKELLARAEKVKDKIQYPIHGQDPSIANSVSTASLMMYLGNRAKDKETLKKYHDHFMSVATNDTFKPHVVVDIQNFEDLKRDLDASIRYSGAVSTEKTIREFLDKIGGMTYNIKKTEKYEEGKDYSKKEFVWTDEKIKQLSNLFQRAEQRFNLYRLRLIEAKIKEAEAK